MNKFRAKRLDVVEAAEIVLDFCKKEKIPVPRSINSVDSLVHKYVDLVCYNFTQGAQFQDGTETTKENALAKRKAMIEEKLFDSRRSFCMTMKNNFDRDFKEDKKVTKHPIFQLFHSLYFSEYRESLKTVIEEKFKEKKAVDS